MGLGSGLGVGAQPRQPPLFAWPTLLLSALIPRHRRWRSCSSTGRTLRRRSAHGAPPPLAVENEHRAHVVAALDGARADTRATPTRSCDGSRRMGRWRPATSATVRARGHMVDWDDAKRSSIPVLEGPRQRPPASERLRSGHHLTEPATPANAVRPTGGDEDEARRGAPRRAPSCVRFPRTHPATTTARSPLAAEASCATRWPKDAWSRLGLRAGQAGLSAP